MRKVSGQPLERLVAERSTRAAGQGRGRGPVDDRLALVPHVLAAANALGHAHRRGVIHRDVKPSNILVGDLGETVVDGMAIVSNLVSCDWLDLATRVRTRIATLRGVVTAQIAAPPTGRQLLDLVNGTRWRVASQDPVKSISMTGRTGLLFAAGRVSVVHFDVPDDREKIREWVLQATNHTLDAAGP